MKIILLHFSKICIFLITRVCLSRKRRKPTHIKIYNKDRPEMTVSARRVVIIVAKNVVAAAVVIVVAAAVAVVVENAAGAVVVENAVVAVENTAVEDVVVVDLEALVVDKLR